MAWQARLRGVSRGIGLQMWGAVSPATVMSACTSAHYFKPDPCDVMAPWRRTTACGPWHDLHAMKRIAIALGEFLEAGMPAALHVNGRTDRDFPFGTAAATKPSISSPALDGPTCRAAHNVPPCICFRPGTGRPESTRARGRSRAPSVSAQRCSSRWRGRRRRHPSGTHSGRKTDAHRQQSEPDRIEEESASKRPSSHTASDGLA
jgi:hypothetical protein